jgi:hypothetical protein
VIALALYLLGPPGNDQATHLYQTQMFEREGWRFWHNLWYGGHYSQVNYSLTFYPLAAVLGTAAVVAGGAAGAAAGFASVVRREWPRLATVPAVVFATTVPLAIIAGTYPFLLAMAPGLFAVAAVQRRRPLVATLLATLTAATHPLAFGFLVAGLIGAATVARGWWRDRTWLGLAGGLAAVTAVQAVLTRAFTAPGVRYPFDEKDALAIGAFCIAGVVLTHGLRDQRWLRMLFVAYAVISAIALLVSSPVGGNVVRLMLLMGTPLILIPIAARRYRPRWVALPLAAGALSWQILPAVTGWSSIANAGAPTPGFWRPIDAFLDGHADPNHRVEVVATVDNWEAYYVARRGVALARGWYRQYDWPPNAPLYQPLTVPVYHNWLRRMAVRYVLLPDDPLDGSTRYEVALLHKGAGLRLVERVGRWTIYELPNATPIATPRDAIRVTSMTAEGIDLQADRPGVYYVRVRYTPYWRVVRGTACVAPRDPFGITLRVARSGPVSLAFDVDLGKVVNAALGRDEAHCPPEKDAVAATRVDH